MCELDFLDGLYETVKEYRGEIACTSVFKDISGYWYRENYHSDILAYYLKDNLVKKELINWLNILKQENPINADEYFDGSVERESGRIDILICSTDRRKAIFIENKSNNAMDQSAQLYRYYRELSDKKIEVEAILYLNKSIDNNPSLSYDKSEAIKDILCIGNLRGFNDNVVKNVILNTNNIRLNALSQEIGDLFNYLVCGDINMENLGNFMVELSKNGNLEKLEKAIRAYNDIPVFLAKKYEAYIKSKTNNYVWLYKPWYIAVEFPHYELALDIDFSTDLVIFSFVPRGENTQAVEDLKEKSGEKFPFNDKVYKGARYGAEIRNPINNPDEVKQKIDELLEFLKTV